MHRFPFNVVCVRATAQTEELKNFPFLARLCRSPCLLNMKYTVNSNCTALLREIFVVDMQTRLRAIAVVSFVITGNCGMCVALNMHAHFGEDFC